MIDEDAYSYLQEQKQQQSYDRTQHTAAGARFVLSTPQGRRFMADLLALTGIYRSSFSTESLVMAFSEGSRNVGLQLLKSLVAHAPESYDLMLKENKQ